VVLDAGCGRGDFLDYLLDQDIHPIRYIGIEAVETVFTLRARRLRSMDGMGRSIWRGSGRDRSAQPRCPPDRWSAAGLPVAASVAPRNAARAKRPATWMAAGLFSSPENRLMLTVRAFPLLAWR
jgi:hypothetical protein